MKKLFISCPMKGRTEENIRNSMERMHDIAELVFDQELEVIPTYIEHIPPETKNWSLWCLGESIKKMAEADYFIGVRYADQFTGCYIEAMTARDYDIPMYVVDIDYIAPDVCDQ